MAFPLRLALALLSGFFLASCATQTPHVTTASVRAHLQKVRTTAYCHGEGSGSRNAIGQRLSGGRLKSASADWSRFPLGTRFRVLRTGDEYIIDDYGSALVGTNTIDLYQSSRGEMYRWGVRQEEIDILHWGSEDESLRILRKRKGIGRVGRMIASLEKNQNR